MKKLLIPTAALLLLVAVLGQSVQAQDSSNPVGVFWREDGVKRSVEFNPSNGAYVLGFKDGQAWVGDIEGFLFIFTPDGGRYSIQAMPGDLNSDGAVNVLDAIVLMQHIVGLE